MKKKVILTDIDGVVLNWEEAFNTWMERKGFKVINPNVFYVYDRFEITKEASKNFVRTFNESAQIGYLRPLRDSAYYLWLLHKELGYVFHSITSLSLDVCAQSIRIMNLKRIFGEDLFQVFLFADTGQDKKHLLDQYRNTGYVWVEDKPNNVLDGIDVGLTGYLMHHEYNKDFLDLRVKRVNNWKEIYQSLKED